MFLFIGILHCHTRLQLEIIQLVVGMQLVVGGVGMTNATADLVASCATMPIVIKTIS